MQWIGLWNYSMKKIVLKKACVPVIRDRILPKELFIEIPTDKHILRCYNLSKVYLRKYLEIMEDLEECLSKNK
jgi:hypothetical protein